MGLEGVRAIDDNQQRKEHIDLPADLFRNEGRHSKRHPFPAGQRLPAALRFHQEQLTEEEKRYKVVIGG